MDIYPTDPIGPSIGQSTGSFSPTHTRPPTQYPHNTKEARARLASEFESGKNIAKLEAAIDAGDWAELKAYSREYDAFLRQGAFLWCEGLRMEVDRIVSHPTCASPPYFDRVLLWLVCPSLTETPTIQPRRLPNYRTNPHQSTPSYPPHHANRADGHGQEGRRGREGGAVHPGGHHVQPHQGASVMCVCLNVCVCVLIITPFAPAPPCGVWCVWRGRRYRSINMTASRTPNTTHPNDPPR